MPKKSILSLFMFESKKEKEAKAKAYQNRMFPLGLNTERDWEIKTLKKAFPGMKDISQLQYSLLVLRENLYDTQLPEDDDNHLTYTQAMKMWDKQATTKFLKDDQTPFVRSMAILENAATCVEDLPTIEDIRKHMALYTK